MSSLSSKIFSTLTILTISTRIIYGENHTCIGPDISNSIAPGKNFDLSKFKLTVPTPSSSSEISPSDLEKGYTSNWFYTDSDDGSMTFFCPGYGGTTPDTSYPRSELRHMCNPSDDNDNWYIGDGVHELWAEIRVDKNISAAKVVVAQIHGFGSSAQPLVKVQWESKSGGLFSFVTQSNGDEPKYDLATDINYDKFEINLKINADSVLTIIVNNKQYIEQDVSYFSYGCYFKQGNYLQSDDKSDYSIVHTYCLNVTNSGSCKSS